MKKIELVNILTLMCQNIDKFVIGKTMAFHICF